jgi:hypothetical protein
MNIEREYDQLAKLVGAYDADKSLGKVEEISDVSHLIPNPSLPQ